MRVFEVVFWLCAACLFHSYLFYPFLLRLLTRKKQGNGFTYEKPEDCPAISILIAAHNEELVIHKKLQSILTSNFPVHKLEILIGSDCSTDSTNSIVAEFCAQNSAVKLIPFEVRTGKVEIINRLSRMAAHDLLVITDANVLFDENTLFELARHFRNNAIGLVDSNMINRGLKKEGISKQEKTYIRSEVKLKKAESLFGGCMIGPFGGCYALRKNYFTEVPSHFLVDDFYINMKVLEKGGQCINELNARVYEDVSNNLSEEYRRKVRIATGNFQNLAAFKRLLFRFNKVAFCFISHKVLRWIGPFFLILALLSSVVLAKIFLYRVALIVQLLFYSMPLIDLFLRKCHIHLFPLRLITHLLAMNLALLSGFIRYLRGVKSSIWQPTQRHQ